jgi:hypothetical protein
MTVSPARSVPAFHTRCSVRHGAAANPDAPSLPVVLTT